MTQPDTNTSGEISTDEILSELRAEIKAAKSVYAWARSNGLLENQVYPILKGKRKMEPAVAAALGYYPVRKWAKND
jgi:hypothetical protein